MKILIAIAFAIFSTQAWSAGTCTIASGDSRYVFEVGAYFLGAFWKSQDGRAATKYTSNYWDCNSYPVRDPSQIWRGPGVIDFDRLESAVCSNLRRCDRYNRCSESYEFRLTRDPAESPHMARVDLYQLGNHRKTKILVNVACEYESR